MPALLELDRIRVRYSGLPVVHDVSLAVPEGCTVCVVGANGAGKSTILRAIMGSRKILHGRILYRGEPIHTLGTEAIVRKGIVYVPEEKMLFKPLTVEDNLLLGAYTVMDDRRIRDNLSYVYDLFPRLKERSRQTVATLSGGEQQMVAVGRGLMSSPTILMLDEPSLGLAPRLVDELLDTIATLKNQGMTILLVEQNVRESLGIADYGYILQTGRIVQEGPGRELLESSVVQKAFLGL